MKPLLITILLTISIAISCRRSTNNVTGIIANIADKEQHIFISENIEDSLKSFTVDAKELLGNGVMSVIVRKPLNGKILLDFFYSESLIDLKHTPSTKNYRMVGLRDYGHVKVLVQYSNISSDDSIVNEAILDSLQGERLYNDEFVERIPSPFMHKRYEVIGKDSLLLVVSRIGGFRIKDSKQTYWENLSPEEKKVVTDKVKRSKSIVASYVLQKFTVGDNNQTDSLLSVLSKRPSNGEVKCLHFHLFNDIAIKSDGAVAEMVCEYIEPMLLSDVDYVLPYIMNHKEYYSLYTSMLAENLYLKGIDYSDSIRLFNQFRLKLTTNPVTDRKSVNTFCESVRSSITELWNE